MEALCLHVFSCKVEIPALLKGQKAVTHSFDRHELITHCAPGAVLAAYNSESAGHSETVDI